MTGKRRERPGMILYYHHMKQAVEKLTTPELGELTRALFAYANGGETEMEMSEKVGIFFGFMTDAIDRDNERYQETCEKNREHANRRWANERTKTEEAEAAKVGDGCALCAEDNGGSVSARMLANAEDANQTQPNLTQPDLTQPNQTEPKQKTVRARGANSSALYGRRGDGRNAAAAAGCMRPTAVGGVCGDPIPWA